MMVAWEERNSPIKIEMNRSKVKVIGAIYIFAQYPEKVIFNHPIWYADYLGKKSNNICSGQQVKVTYTCNMELISHDI